MLVRGLPGKSRPARLSEMRLVDTWRSGCFSVPVESKNWKSRSTHRLSSIRIDESSRQDIDERQDHRDEQAPHRDLGRVHRDSDNRQHKEEHEHGPVPPIRYLGIASHQLRMDIIFLRLQSLDTADEVFTVV